MFLSALQDACGSAFGDVNGASMVSTILKKTTATDDPVAFFTFLLVIVGIFQVLLFYVQLILIRRSLSDTKEAAEAATVGATAAKISADATKEIVFTLQDNARKQMRAHVFPDNAGVMDESNFNTRIPVREKQPWVSYVIRNSGLTPAYKLIHWGKMDIIEIINESILVAPPLEDNHKIILPPNGISTKSFWFGRPLSDSEISDINNFVRAIYIYGVIQYYDIHGQKYISTYRLKYAGLYPPSGSGAFSFCEEGNDESGVEV
jgi:hypothetical protein